MSTSKTDLYLQIPRRNAKEKTSKLFPLGPLTTSKKQKKLKKKRKKKSKTKTTRKKIQEKKTQGNDRAMKKSFTATENKMPNQSRQCVILTKKSAECAEKSSLRRHEGPAAVSTSPPFAFLEVPAPQKKMKKKESFVATFVLGGGGGRQ